MFYRGEVKMVVVRTFLGEEGFLPGHLRVQSVLYGKNVLGGIVNVISKKPGNTNQGKFSLRGESYETATASGIFRGSKIGRAHV